MVKLIQNERGYTVVELLIVVGGLLSIVVAGLGVWVAVHFLAKYW